MNDLINQRCLETLGLTGEQLVLDVGCGTGPFMMLMAQSLPAEVRIVAVERDPAQLDAARDSQQRNRPAGRFGYRQGNAPDIPLTEHERGRVDLADARFLLERAPDPAVVVAAMVEALMAGGRVVLADDDHEIMRFGPEPEGAAAAWRADYQRYRSLGAPRWWAGS